MTLNKKAAEVFYNNVNRRENFELSLKVLSWAHLNFELQLFLSKLNEKFSDKTYQQLREIGYEGRPLQELTETEYKELFEKEAFFSSSQTGKRIAAFALKINGVNQDRFEEIEESITNAYKDIQLLSQEDKLLERSYLHCLDTLCVFKR